MTRRFVCATSALGLAALVVVATVSYAQVDTGAILGTVKDSTGAVIPGATVTLTNEGTTFTLTTTTGADGSYIFTPIKIGTYSVTAEFAGFQKAVYNHIEVDLQQQALVDFVLKPGQVTQTVEVTSAPPLLDTQSGSVGQVVASRAINELPLNGRNFTFLAQLSAGVTFVQQDNRGFGASGTFSANGTPYYQNNYLLDGIDNNNDQPDVRSGTAFVVRPPVDAIQEFKVQTNSYGAEFGRGGGAVLNATLKSGTNRLHGDAWEFLRNDKFDAADFFLNAARQPKGEFRQNQFGFSLGGPVVIPRLYSGKNKMFWFFDYEGTRIRQASPAVTTVPTLRERASGYTDFADLITGQSGTRGPDLLGRSFPLGTIFDPATTRPVKAGQRDPVTGLVATGAGFVRDPFSGNQINPLRLDPNAVKLLNLFPQPNAPGLFANYTASPVNRDDINQFDARVDENFSDRDQTFARLSYFHQPVLKPGPFPGVADGGSSTNNGDKINTAVNAGWSETHSFSSSAVNEFRIGYNRLRTVISQAFAQDLSDIPGKFGIQGIPQAALNGGLPRLNIGSYGFLGSSTFLPVDKISTTVQVTENLTKIRRSHAFKGGFEFQHLYFDNFAPPASRGEFGFNGVFTTIPTKGDSSTGVAQFLVTPVKSTVPGGVDFVGGESSVFVSNFATPSYSRNYYGLYFKDDWKVTPKLTLNLGLRWEWFGLAEENFGAQANLIPGAPFNSARFLFPLSRIAKQPLPLSSDFLASLAKDGIALGYSTLPSLGTSQKTNFAPRLGFAYRLRPKVVLRGGYGIFYSGFVNIGGSQVGSNYPFLFRFNIPTPDPAHPIIYSDGNRATLEQGLLSVPLNPQLVRAAGLQLFGIQFDFETPYIQAYNVSLQYQLTPNQSLQIGYVASLGHHLESQASSNQVTQILPPGINPQPFVPFPDFGRGATFVRTDANSYYHSLQATFERRFSHGLSFLANYTWGKVRTDVRDPLVGNVGGYRALWIPGFGIQGDYGLADFDVRQILHFSGGYELPVGRGRAFLSNAGGFLNAVLGGWSTNWILTLQDGQPQTIGCTPGAAPAGAGCHALLVPGQNRIGGPHDVNNFYNFAAFQNPAPAAQIGQTDFGPLGGAPTQVVGPGFHRFDWSVFKQFRTSESTRLEFRAEFFNLTNHPNFALPSFLNFDNQATFGKIDATRDRPNDPREVQFALKFYF